jgi:hypothetical protein
MAALTAVPKLRKAQQPPLSYKGATPDSDRAKQPTLVEPAATEHDLNPGDRVEGLGNFGVPTGEVGAVEKTNEDDALVKWDGGGPASLFLWSRALTERRAADPPR